MTPARRKALGYEQMNTCVPAALRQQAMTMFKAHKMTYREWLIGELRALVAHHEWQQQQAQTPADMWFVSYRGGFPPDNMA